MSYLNVVGFGSYRPKRVHSAAAVDLGKTCVGRSLVKEAEISVCG